MSLREFFDQGHHPILPAELATNPGVHAGAISAVLAVIAGALPAIAAIMPIIYYALLIADHLADRWRNHKHRRRHHARPRHPRLNHEAINRERAED